MAEKAKDIIRWLKTLPEEEIVGIDEDGLSIITTRPDVYFEIGGFPEEDEDEER